MHRESVMVTIYKLCLLAGAIINLQPVMGWCSRLEL